MPVDVDALVGRTLAGRYRVVRQVGRGGMGAVFEAVQLDLERRVAIKVLFEEDPRALERFRQEALATGNLVATNIVAISDFCEPPDAPPFIVMELLEGEALSKLLGREPRLAPARAVGIALQVLAGLSVAHAAGVFHRDIKPANLFLTKTAMAGDLVKVLDFGIAKVAEGGVATTTGAFMGTPSYLAPEQIVGGPIGAWTDTRAVGVVLYEMLAGARPWNGADILTEVLSRDAPLLGTVRPELAAVVARALAREPAERFATAEAMVAALRPFAADLDRPPARVAQSAGRGRWPVFALGFAAPVLAGGVVLAVVANRARPPPPVLPLAPSSQTDAAPIAPLQEPVDAPEEAADSAAPAPPRAAVLDGDCLCVEARNAPLRVLLCPEKMLPRCSCATLSGEKVCSEPLWPRDGGVGCNTWDDFGRVGSVTGDKCSGNVLLTTNNTTRSVLTSGLLTCTFCYGMPRGRTAIHGTRCTGFNGPGRQSEGLWECAVLRARP